MDAYTGKNTDYHPAHDIERPVNPGIDATDTDKERQSQIPGSPFFMNEIHDGREGEERGHMAGGKRIIYRLAQDERGEMESFEWAQVMIEMADCFGDYAARQKYGKDYFESCEDSLAPSAQPPKKIDPAQNQKIRERIGNENSNAIQGPASPGEIMNGVKKCEIQSHVGGSREHS
jgi:hypothetical protein